MSISALQAAKRACEASDWTLTNLQLQKILYIAHMLYAGQAEGKKLIWDEPFEAWDYGPVLPKVYQHVRSFGGRPIKNVFHWVDSAEEGDETKIIDSAVRKLAHVQPFKLVELVHDKNSAWARHYRPGCLGTVIPQEDVEAEYVRREGASKRAQF